MDSKDFTIECTLRVFAQEAGVQVELAYIGASKPSMTIDLSYAEWDDLVDSVNQESIVHRQAVSAKPHGLSVVFESVPGTATPIVGQMMNFLPLQTELFEEQVPPKGQGVPT